MNEAKPSALPHRIWDCVSNGRSLQEEIEQYTLPELRKLAERGVPLEEETKK